MNVKLTIITKEETKKLVRLLGKRVVKEEEYREMVKELYYGGKGKLGWFMVGKEPFGWRRLRIPVLTAYERNDKGLLVRKNLRELDNLIYKKVNSSREAIKVNRIKKVKKEKLKGINRKLDLARVSISQTRYGESIRVVIDVRKGINNKYFKGLDGIDLSKIFFKYIEDSGNEVSGYYEESEKEHMEVLISDNYVGYWGSFIDVLIEFEKELLKNNK